MQKRKFDELISHFNRKVSEMSIEQKYKMELHGMISALGFAHEKELGTNLAEVGTDLISRQAAIDAISEYGNGSTLWMNVSELARRIEQLPAIQPDNNSEVPNSSDCISRQAAKNAICNACGKIDCDEMDTCKKLAIPSEGSKALEWQYHSYIPHNKYCPKCGKDSPYNKRWNFCPNCGADMRGEQDEP